jgi:hypothetical protein
MAAAVPVVWGGSTPSSDASDDEDNNRCDEQHTSDDEVDRGDLSAYSPERRKHDCEDSQKSRLLVWRSSSEGHLAYQISAVASRCFAEHPSEGRCRHQPRRSGARSRRFSRLRSYPPFMLSTRPHVPVRDTPDNLPHSLTARRPQGPQGPQNVSKYVSKYVSNGDRFRRTGLNVVGQ